MSDFDPHISPVVFVGAFLVVAAAAFFVIHICKHGFDGLRTPVEHSDHDSCVDPYHCVNGIVAEQHRVAHKYADADERYIDQLIAAGEFDPE